MFSGHLFRILLFKPTDQLALRIIPATWTSQFRSLDSSTPRYLWWSTASKGSPWMVYYWYSTRDFEHETLRMVHFFALNYICHVSAQCTSAFRSCCSDSASLQSLNTPYKTALSAKSQFALLRFGWYRYRLAVKRIAHIAGFWREEAINACENALSARGRRGRYFPFLLTRAY